MTKAGVFDCDPTAVAKAKELKRELQKLVKNILEEDDDFIDGGGVQTIDKLQEVLSALKEMKMRKSSSSFIKIQETMSFPEELRCPLSNELMKDPVVLASGQTYDRAFIHKWLSSGHRTCPKTQQVLSDTALTPNVLIRESISKWCKNIGIEPPNRIHQCVGGDEEPITRSDRENFNLLLNKISSQVAGDQKSAAKELRLLTKQAPRFRALFRESPDGIHRLINPLKGLNSKMDENLQEDVITTLLNISIHDSNKKLVCENPNVIPLLIEALRRGEVVTRSNAAAAIFSLSAFDSNKVLLGESGVLKPLIELLEEGHPLAIKDVASAIFSLCIVHENRARAVSDGAVSVIVKKIMDGLHLDELLAILAILVNHQKTVEETGKLGAVSCLLRIIRECDCQRNKENAIAIVHTICFRDRTKWKEVREEENVYGTISKLAEAGTSRAKRKANGILERLRRTIDLTHTA